METPETNLRTVTSAAAGAAQSLGDSSAPWRAEMLHAAADDIDKAIDELVVVADDETALGDARLRGEVGRTTAQLRLFAEVILEGSYLEATIDHAEPESTPPRPDLRRMLHPLGPVAVFSASNFPFAFSVAGGDTAAALAAGCPVIVKAHSGHPRLSARVSTLMRGALDRAGAPRGTFACVSGRETGRELVRDPHVKAVGFTGSLEAGRALFDLACGRPDPIPFYGELSSVNPVLVTRAAVRRRGTAIAEGLVGSFTLGAGQFCTKPGVVMVPRGSGFEELVAAALGTPEPARMLTPQIAGSFRAGLDRLENGRQVELVAGSTSQPEDVQAAEPVVFATEATCVLAEPELIETECFGPVCLLVRYDDEELSDLVAALPGALAMAIHAEREEAKRLDPWLRRLRDRAGRLVWNGWPTGVAVTWSMHHGGPWPATTNALHSSVGTSAIRRFLRPVAYQDCPQELLPPALHDENPLGLPRRINGRATLP